jgi:uncharacterized protein (UPF0332 family)
VNEDVARLVSQSDEELAAARRLSTGGFHRQAASRAYYAAFYAAEAALLSIGEFRSKHSGVVSAFGQHVVKRGGMDPENGRLIRGLFASRGEADYGAGTTEEEATAAIEDARRFVAAVRDWLSSAG